MLHRRRARMPSGSHPSGTVVAQIKSDNRAIHPLSPRERGYEDLWRDPPQPLQSGNKKCKNKPTCGRPPGHERAKANPLFRLSERRKYSSIEEFSGFRRKRHSGGDRNAWCSTAVGRGRPPALTRLAQLSRRTRATTASSTLSRAAREGTKTGRARSARGAKEGIGREESACCSRIASDFRFCPFSRDAREGGRRASCAWLRARSVTDG